MTREIEARLKVTGRDATGNMFSSLAAKMGQVNKAVGALNRQQHVLTRTAEASAAMITRYAAPAALAYGAKVALTDFAALERQMTRIGTTAGASEEALAGALDVVKRLSRDTGYSDFQPAIEAVETLTASGLDLKDAMAFLPSVLATAQASGSATADIANTGLKSASALKIQTADLQRAFDVMVALGKAGQFELPDMAQYVPGLANSFASLGYEGEEGLVRLGAILQTLREDTGDASSAATQAGEIFGKIYAGDTITKFKKFGIDLRKEMDKAKKSGVDTVSAFVAISNKALKGDMSKLPLLFSDKEFRLGMQSLLTSGDSLQKFVDVAKSTDVDGTVFRDLNRVLSDTQAKIDRMSSSWETMVTAVGGAIAGPASVAMDAVSDFLSYDSAVNNALEKRGVSGFLARTKWGLGSSQEEKDVAAYEGGYGTPQWRYEHEVKTHKAVNGLDMPIPPEFPGGALKRDAKGRLVEFPIPTPRPEPPKPFSMDSIPAPQMLPPVPDALLRASSRSGPVPLAAEWRDAMKIGTPDFRPLAEEAGRQVAEGGREAGQHIEQSTALLKVAGHDVGAAISQAAQQMIAAAQALATAKSAAVTMGGLANPRSAVNANLGSTVPPLTP